MAKKKGTRTDDTNEPTTERTSRSKRFPLPSFTTLIRSEHTWSVFFAILFLAIAIAFTIDVRLQTANIDLADDWAQQSVDNQGVAYMTQLIRQQYPTLPDTQVQQEAQRRWADYREQNEQEITQQQAAIAAQLRDNYQFTMADGTQQTYVFEMDPYLFWQMAYNEAMHGSVCEPGSETLYGTVCRDEKRLAPIGTTQGRGFHVLIESWLIKLFHDPEAPALDSLRAIFYLPVILMVLAMIPAFFLGRKLAGNVGGFVAAVMLAAHPVIMNRTVAGWADTDPYAIVFPLFMLWFAIEAFRANTWLKRLAFAVAIGIVTGLYAFAWGGWWLMFVILVICMLAYLAYEAVFITWQSRSFKPATYKALIPGVAVMAAFIATTGITTVLTSSWATFAYAFTAPFALTTGLQAATAPSAFGWPNILTTVAELNIANLTTIVNNFGGRWLVTIAAFGLFALLLDPRRMTWKHWGIALAAFVYYASLVGSGLALDPRVFIALFALPLVIAVLVIFWKRLDVDLRASVFIMGWLLATFFAATQGIRFILLGVPAFAVAFGIAIGWTFIAFSEALIALWNKPFAVKGVVGVLLLFLVFNPVAAYNPIEQAYASGKQQAPGINDAWWNAMTYLREQTPEDTIVTSWWDFGHWFRNIGNRSVTFDGGSQNPEPGHLVGKVLLTSDEREALGILRMLNCGQNTAYELAYASTDDVVASKRLIDELVLLDREGAQRRLAQTDIPAEDRSSILENTHCEPRNQVFITSGDMIGKAGVWGHFGSWSFERSMAYIHATSLPRADAIARIESTGLTTAEATALYEEARALPNPQAANTWISGWPNYFTQNWVGCTRQNQTYSCGTPFGYMNTAEGTLAVDRITFRGTNPSDAAITLGVYSQQGRIGELVTRPTEIAFLPRGATDLRITRPSRASDPPGLFVPSVLIQELGTLDAPEYRVLFADEQQVDSLFTQLYFLDGATTQHFTKASTHVEIGGGVITIWDVEFPEE